MSSNELRPHAGPQEKFLACPADIAIYGGAAGGGKTYAELMEPLRHKDNGGFDAVIFRRESGQIANAGGPWDTAKDMYLPFVDGPRSFVTTPKHQVRFPSGMTVTFSHMQQEKHMRSWDGSQIALIAFDELQHFTERQFFYMLSRNRTMCGVRPYMRATCNPDPDSFLLEFLGWWIDPETGWPIEERSGVIRYFVRLGGIVHWADTPKELHEQFDEVHGAESILPKSCTFIKSVLADNPTLVNGDPGYRANINAMLDYERLRLEGNWFARATVGSLFKRHYFEIVDEYDHERTSRIIRYWDRAATEPSESNQDPDWTAGVLMAFSEVEDCFIILDIARERMEPADVEALIEHCVQADYWNTVLGLEQEPGASGKSEVSHYAQKYGADHEVHIAPKTKNKLTCWKPLAREAKKGRVLLLRGEWNRAFLQEVEAVTDGTQKGHDDQTDGAAGCIAYLMNDDFGFASH